MEKQRLHRLLISPSQILILHFSFSQKPAASSPQRRLQLPSSSLSPYNSTAVGRPSLIESPALSIAGDSHRSSPYLSLFLSPSSFLSLCDSAAILRRRPSGDSVPDQEPLQRPPSNPHGGRFPLGGIAVSAAVPCSASRSRLALLFAAFPLDVLHA